MEEKDILKEEVGQQQDAVNEEAGDVQVDAQPETETEEKTMEEKLVELQLENARLNDQLLRKIAEFENFRKRTIKEKTDLILNGGQKVLESLLPVLDDLGRAQENIDKSTDVEQLKEGVDLIISKLTKTLSAQGLKKIETEGKVFDTDFHEAIALVPVEDAEKKNQIIDCVQAGYLLNDKVIRHAKVVVGQ
jgi:molecular chaperone GrpE